jgi:signal transduction histidine kinase
MNRRPHVRDKILRQLMQARIEPLRWLILLGFPLVAALGGVIIVSLVYHNASMHTMVAERDAMTARAIASLLSQKMEDCPPPQTGAATRAELAACLRDVNLSEMVLPIEGHRQITGFVFDANGAALAHTNPAGLGADVSAYPGVKDALNGISGSTSTLFGPDYQDRVVAYAPILVRGKTGQMGLVMDEPWDEAQDLFTRFSLLIPFVAVAVMAVSGLVFALVTRAQTQHQDLRRYARALTNAQETERARLARDLHDGTVQDLVALHQKTQLLRMDAANDAPHMLGRIENLRDETRHLIDDVRRVSHALKPVHLDELGLAPALERMAGEMNDVCKQQDKLCRIVFTGNVKRKRLDKNVEVALYRIAQEAITNAMRYSGASDIRLSISDEDNEAHLVVEDNGKGFDPYSARVGLGLISMRERASFVDGVTIVQTEPDRGTRIDVYAPV